MFTRILFSIGYALLFIIPVALVLAPGLALQMSLHGMSAQTAELLFIGVTGAAAALGALFGYSERG
jgi:hypothetical protein